MSGASSRLVRRSSRTANPRVEEDPDENLPITSGNNTYVSRNSTFPAYNIYYVT